MNIYKCPACGTKYNDADLLVTKCSENFVGTYQIQYCPKCINKRKNKGLYKLIEVGGVK